jgi:hypothetical protein
LNHFAVDLGYRRISIFNIVLSAFVLFMDSAEELHFQPSGTSSTVSAEVRVWHAVILK